MAAVEEEEQRWSALEVYFDSNIEVYVESAVALIGRGRLREGSQAIVAIKSASLDPRISHQPHDIGKELRLLKTLSCVNVVEVLGSLYEQPARTLHFWMPLIPHHLSDILNSPMFSPPTDFIVVFKSLLYQMLSALAYIHAHGVAHRDMKPRNILITDEGLVKMIDFGVSWTEAVDEHDLWPEPRGHMCFDVATGYGVSATMYRGATLWTRDYDAQAIDLWAMGVLTAHCFTPLLRVPEEEDSDTAEMPAKSPFIIPKGFSPGQEGVEWTRDELYDGDRGQIGLAWSIFKVHGTPNEQSWPSFGDLPDGQKVKFVDVPPPDAHHCFDLVSKLLVYPPESRLRAQDALDHPLCTQGHRPLLPVGYPAGGPECEGERADGT
ncbi:kinase-like protein [Epithele typhae]|uniref:kinase-like protein n=1 Tax=Epithele typhae TaxID=378194 RepID=UPI00200795DC|nr:kinase-like protein [Epithele typhae]KAH9932102.1 kinase-like protein [Epithele typhae]